MIADFPTAEVGTDEFDAHVKASVQQQLAADQAEWEKQFGHKPVDLAPVPVAQSNSDVLIFAAIAAAVWFAAKQ